MNNPEDLEVLMARARSCRLCRLRSEGGGPEHQPRPLFAVSRTARLCIASQAPGIRAHVSGVPFDDRSGDRLREWLGVTREEFYDEERVAILPIGFCFPGHDRHGGDLPPRRECAPAWRAEFLANLDSVELMLCIGQYAQRYHLGSGWRGSVTQTVRDWRSIREATGSPAVLPLPHPSWRNSGWLKRNPWFETELLPHLRTEVRRLLHR